MEAMLAKPARPSVLRMTIRLTILPAFFLSCFVLLAIAATAQSSAPEAAELTRRIERQVRTYAEAPPEASVTLGSRTPSSFNNYDNLPVAITENGVTRTFNFLIAKDSSKLLYVKEFDLTRDPYAVAMSKIDLAGRPVRGAQDAKVTIVMYDDYQCPFCARFYVTLFNEVMNHYRDRVRVITKDFPIVDAHPWAMRAAADSNCLARLSPAAYWQFSDYVHTHQQEFNQKWTAQATGAASLGKPVAFPALDSLALQTGQRNGADATSLQACIAQQNTAPVEASISEGRSLGVSATPTLFVNGEELEGVLTSEQLRIVLDRALHDASSR